MRESILSVMKKQNKYFFPNYVVLVEDTMNNAKMKSRIMYSSNFELLMFLPEKMASYNNVNLNLQEYNTDLQCAPGDTKEYTIICNGREIGFFSVWWNYYKQLCVYVGFPEEVTLSKNGKTGEIIQSMCQIVKSNQEIKINKIYDPNNYFDLDEEKKYTKHLDKRID